MSEQTKYPFGLGERVRFTTVLERKGIEVPEARTSRTAWQKHWLPVERAGEGVIVGYRTRSHGYTNYDYEDGHSWHSVGTVRCALVAYSLHRAPASVPLDALAPLSHSHSSEG